MINNISAKILIIIFLLFTFLNFADYIISMPYLEAESNPAVILTGTFLSLLLAKVVLNVIMGIFLYNIVKYNNYPFYINYMYVFVLVTFILLMTNVITSNIFIISSPELLEASKAVPSEIKIESYKNIMFNQYVYPIIVAILSTLVYVNVFKPRRR